MAETLEIQVQVLKNGKPLDGYPKIRRIQVDEAQRFTYNKASSVGFAAVPTGEISSVQVLILSADRQITVRLDGQSDAGLVLNAGGLLLILDATIDAGAATNVTVENQSGAVAQIDGLGGGA